MNFVNNVVLKKVLFKWTASLPATANWSITRLMLLRGTLPEDDVFIFLPICVVSVDFKRLRMTVQRP